MKSRAHHLLLSNLTTDQAYCVSQGPLPSSAGHAAERTLSKVGRGVALWLDRSTNTVWLYNRSEFPVFVLSPTTHNVLKLWPGQSACVYRWSALQRTVDDDRKTDLEQTTSPRQPDCIVVSFVKGWSGRYKRQTILSCPCWLQVLLAQTPPTAATKTTTQYAEASDGLQSVHGTISSH